MRIQSRKGRRELTAPPMHEQQILTQSFLLISKCHLSVCNPVGIVNQYQFLTRIGATAVQQVYITQFEECLSVSSNAWQWFYNRTFYNECESLGFKLGTTFDLPHLGPQLQLLTSSTGDTTGQRVSVHQTEECLSILSSTWQLFYKRTF